MRKSLMSKRLKKSISSHISNKDYRVAFGSPNYYPFLKCILVLYERLRLARKVIQDKVEKDFKENKNLVLHSYKAYKKAQERIRENRGLENVSRSITEELKDIIEDDEVIKERVSRHRMAILIGIAITKYKSNLDNGTFEELVRVFLGVKAFFFFTFDKLIVLTNKSFSCLFNDEYQKSFSFTMFDKYNKMSRNKRSKM